MRSPIPTAASGLGIAAVIAKAMHKTTDSRLRHDPVTRGRMLDKLTKTQTA